MPLSSADAGGGAVDSAVVAILKHNTPCGVGAGMTPLEAYERAFETDPESPFGGIIVSNQPFDLALAARVDEIFTEVLIAPAFSEEALALLKKKKNRRLLRFDRDRIDPSQLELRRVFGGLLVQQADPAPDEVSTAKLATKQAPTEAQRRALEFAWRVVKHVKSNAIVFAAENRTLAIGGGATSRVDAVHAAAAKAARVGFRSRARCSRATRSSRSRTARDGDRGRSGRRGPAGRVDPRRRGHRGGRSAGRSDAADGDAALQTLSRGRSTSGRRRSTSAAGARHRAMGMREGVGV